MSDSNMTDGESTLIGNILCLSGSFFYASYTTSMKIRLDGESNTKILILFGFIGFFNIILFWPIFIIFDFLNFENFEFPNSGVFFYLILNGLIATVLSDLIWAFSVILTSPLISTIGLSLTIPLSFLVDFLLQKNHNFNFLYLFGTFLIIISFFVVNISYSVSLKKLILFVFYKLKSKFY
jgi:solute carrier family 35, member F5